MTIPTTTGQLWPAPGMSGLTVRKNGGADVGSRRRLNLIEGSGVTLTVADDGTDNEIDVTIAAAGGGGARVIGCCFDGGGVALTVTGTTKIVVSAPVGGTITAARVLTRGGPGSCTIGVKKSTYATFPGSLVDITGGADVVLTAAQSMEDTTLTGWTTAITAGDVFEFELKAASTIEHATLLLVYTPS